MNEQDRAEITAGDGAPVAVEVTISRFKAARMAPIAVSSKQSPVEPQEARRP